MAIETLELAVFTSVVRLESFAGAAEAHALSASAVSRLIARLEEKLGVRLIQRTTRRLSLTEAGATFHARASRILSDLEEAEAEASASALRPRGTVRISAPVALGRRHLGAAIDDILKAFPELAIDLSLSDRFVDLGTRASIWPCGPGIAQLAARGPATVCEPPDPGGQFPTICAGADGPPRPQTWSPMTA